MIATRRRDALRLFAAAGFVGGLGSVGCRPRSSTSTPSTQPPVVSDAWFEELAGLCDGVTGPDAAELTTHVDAARARMSERGIDALLLEPGPNMSYLGGPGWGRSERPLLLVVPQRGPLAIVCPAFEQRTVLERLPVPYELVPWREHEDPYRRLADAFAGLARAKVALDPTMRQFVAHGLARAMPSATWVADDEVVGPCRLRKHAPELARLRRANEATKKAIRAVQAKVTVGTPGEAIATWMEQALLAAGLVDPWVLALVGPAASFPHGTAESRIVQEGDAVLIDTGASLHGYRSDISRTFVVGSPSPQLRRAWDTVAKAQRAALAMIRPGSTTGSVDAAARAVMAEAGYGADDRYFTHRTGHGIGLEVHEPPYLVGQGTLVLEPGMTMSDEPGIYLPGELGVRIEDIVAVTEDGAEVFGELEPASLP